MIKNLKQLIYRNSNGKTVLIFFILTNLIYILMLAVTIPKVMEYANGMKLLDMMPAGYDAEYVNTLFAALGTFGRHAYLYTQIPLDMIYPGLFGVGYCLLFVWFLQKINRHKSSFFYFCLLPPIAGIADYIENIGIITMLNQYSDITPETVSITNTFSMLKSATTTIYFLALIVLLIVFIAHYIKNKKTGSAIS